MPVAHAPVTGVKVTTIGCGVNAESVAQWVDFIFFEFGHLPLFHSLTGGVNVVEPNDEAAPLRLKFDPVSNPNPDEGFYDPVLRAVWISSQAGVWSVLIHEFGHHVQAECGCLPDGTPVGRSLLTLYEALRRPEASAVEQMASDFEAAHFGTVPFPGAKEFYQAVAAAGGV